MQNTRVHLGTVASAVDRDGGGQMWGGGLEGFSSVGCDQLAQLARVAEGNRPQAMLHALSLHAQHHPSHSHPRQMHSNRRPAFYDEHASSSQSQGC